MNIKKFISKNKRIILIVFTTLIASIISIYMNEYYDADAIYTSLFYIPVILTGLWYYRYIIHLAILFSFYINILDIISKDGLSIDQIFRGLSLIIGASVLYHLRKKSNDKLTEMEYLSLHDSLTGLGNRRYLEESLKQLDHEKNYPLSVIMGDVNGLKPTNDTLGHNKGDDLLQQVSEVLRFVCRSDDIICRYGGDEFVILLPKTSETDVVNVVKRIRRAFDEIKIGQINVSMSLGWSVKSNGVEDIKDIMKVAENYMYKNKFFESPNIRGNIVHKIMNTLKENSGIEKDHSERTGEIGAKISKALKHSEEEIEKHRTACLLHDIGKIAIEQEILTKTTKLTEEEWVIIKRHPEIGYRILNAIPEYAEISDYVLSHHERWDGKGYPKRLKGEEIPYISRIITISDSYDAMTSDHSYRKGLSEEEAIEEIKRCSGTQFDPVIAKVFVEKVLGKEWD